MIRTYPFPAKLSRTEADALNRESGRIYTRLMVTQWRVLRQSGEHWLSPDDAEKLDDYYGQDDSPLLHSHSIDAAQQAFAKACKTTRALRKIGMAEANFPRHRKWFRTTTWKSTGIRQKGDTIILARARGLAPIVVTLPDNLTRTCSGARSACAFHAGVGQSFVEARLVYDRVGRRYDWHLVVDDKLAPPPAPGSNVAAVDLGEIHPAAVSDGIESVVFSARELRSVRQNTNRRLAGFQKAMASKTKRSRNWKRLQRRKVEFLAQQKRRTKDIEHKVSRGIVDWAVEREVGTLAIGDVRDIADGKRLNTKSQQKISNWSHGKLRNFITYKAESAGIDVALVNEKDTTKTCPVCRHKHKPTGRKFFCPACGFCGHRDGQVGTVNILSTHLHGEPGYVRPPPTTKYRHPFQTGKRSRPDTAHVAESSHVCS